MKTIAGTAGLLFVSALSTMTHAQTISNTLVANNLWWANEVTGDIPNDAALNYVKTAGTKLIRIGGHQFDDSMPSPQIMETWVLKIRSLGAEPIVQVSQYNSATTYNDRIVAATNMVQYLNITKKLNIKYWSIGNEPWLQLGASGDHANVAPTVATYIKAISPAMKAIDPTIKIMGPDEAYFMDDVYAQLFTAGGTYDIGGKIPGKTYYYLDGITWHTYPNKITNPALDGAASILSQTIKCKTLVDATNARNGRTGSEALIWGIGEYNAPSASLVHTFENGQMFGQALGYGMKYQAAFMATWSILEHSGDRTGTDFSMIDGDTLPRASYYHMEFVGNYMKGNYADGTSNDTNVVGYGAINGAVITAMLMNRGTSSKTITLRLNTDAINSSNVKININAKSAQEYITTIGANTTLFLVFNGNQLTKSTYSKTHFTARIAPTLTTETLTSPGGTTTSALPLANGTFTANATGWTLFSNAPTGDLRDVRYENNLVRFYTDATELNWHAQLYQKLNITAGNTYSLSCDLETTGTNATKAQLFIEEDVDNTNIVTNTCDVTGDGVTRCIASGFVPVGGDTYQGKFGVRLANTADNLGWDFTVDNCTASVTSPTTSSSAAASSIKSSAASSLKSSTASSVIASVASSSVSSAKSSLAASLIASSSVSSPKSSTAASVMSSAKSRAASSIAVVVSSVSASSKSNVSASSVSSSSSSTAVSNSCQYVVTNQWNTGFTGEIRITNNKTTTINGWNVAWGYSDGSRVTSGWNSVMSGSNPYTASNLSWNGTIQPGQTVAFGIQGTKGAATASVVTITGSVCQ